MRVQMLTSSFPRYKGDSLAPFVFELSRHLVQRKIIVTVLSPQYPGCTRTEVMQGVKIERFFYFLPHSRQDLASGFMPALLQTSNFHRMMLLPYLLSAFLNLQARVHNADIIHSQWGFPSGLIASRVRTKKPHVISVHGVEVLLARKMWFMRTPLVNTFQKADLIITNSHFTTQQLFSLGKIDTPVKIIPSGVDTAIFKPYSVRDAQERLNLPDRPTILFVGRLIERKGVHILIKALEQVHKQIEDVLLLIVNDGPEKGRLLGLTEKLDLKDNVKFCGRVPHTQLPDYYNACDIFVNPSIIDKVGDTEGLGVSILEAMASGKPAVVSKVGGITTILRYKGAVGVPPAKPEVLASKIIELLEDPLQRKHIGDNAVKTIKENFSWPILAQKFEQAYKSLQN
ncbi:MAG: glycosyltransferase [Promethearchaeota archaeon]